MSEPTSRSKCQLCGEPMPKGEEMFNYHGYSGPCPKPPLLSTPTEPTSRSVEPDQFAATEHTRSCPALNPGDIDADCTCGLQWRIDLQTEREMHNAWRKRAEEAELELTAARDRERVYRELVEAELALEPLWQSASWRQIEQAKKRVQTALAEVAKMGG